MQNHPKIPCTVTVVLALALMVQPLFAANVLFIVSNPGAPANADPAVLNHLQNDLGHVVTLVDDNGIAESAASGMDLILCSSTVTSGNVGATFLNTAIPFINWEAGLQDDMAMVAAAANGFDRPGQTDIDIVDAAHPLAAGLAAGVHTVVTSVQGFTAGNAGANAQVIATITTNANEACIYVYETGALLVNGSPAPARRIHIFLQNTAFANLNAEGLALFDAAVAYALSPLSGDAPRIEDLVPGRALFHDPNEGITFHARTDPPNSIAPSGIQLIVNGTDVSGSLTITGTGTDRAVSYLGLETNTFYTNVEIIVTDLAGHSTSQIFSFDTLGENCVVIENEDYNYGLDGAGSPVLKFCTTGDLVPPPAVSGGGFQDDPPPSGFTPGQVQVNGSGFGYLDTFAVAGVDYSDSTTNFGCTTVSCPNVYRACTPVGVLENNDVVRKKYLDLDLAAWDLEIHQVQAGDWLNYTRTFPATNYLVYLRARATAARTLTLSRVTSNPILPNQTTQVLGEFQAPTTVGYEYIPLRDVGGTDPLVIGFSGIQTMRLTALSAANDVFLNFLVFVPTSQPVTPLGPVVTVQGPAPGSTVSIHTPISATIMNRSTLTVVVGSIQLFLNGTNVTAESTRTAITGGATISYQPAIPLAFASSFTVTVAYNDTGANSYSNEWSFLTAVPMPPTVAITSPAEGATFASGQDVPITVDAQSDAGIARVEFFADRWKIGESTAAPFAFTWTMPVDGRYNLVARAYDTLGDSTDSAVVRMVVGTDLAPYVLFVGKIDELAIDHTNRVTDELVVKHLESFGLDVLALDEDIVQTSDADGKQFIVNSSSETSGDVNTKFLSVPVPFLNWESGLQDDMQMADNVAPAGDINAQTDLIIVDPFHPLAAGLELGTHTVVNGGPNNWTSGNPNANAQVIATCINTIPCFYVYEPGAQLLDGTPAPALRMHIFFRDTTFSVLNETGLALFNAAIFYGLGATPPSVSVVTPTNDQPFSVGNSVPISATVTPGSNVIEKVSFYLDGLKIGEDTTSPYEGTWPSATFGAHTISVVAKDSLGLENTAEVTVNIGDVEPPTVIITSPAEGATMAEGANVPITVNATDNTGVSRVEYYVYGEFIGQSMTAPFDFTWTNPANGLWRLTARGYDARTNNADSAPVHFRVGPQPSYDAGLVGHWPFEEGAGTTAYDHSGLDNDGALLGTGGPQYVAGRGGNHALAFTGAASGGRVDAGNDPSLRITGAITVAAWAWPNVAAQQGRIVAKTGGSSDRGYELNMENNAIWRFRVSSNESATVAIQADTPDNSVVPNAWTHVAGVFDPDPDPSVLRLYTNGVLAAEVLTPSDLMRSSPVNLTIGSRGTGSYFNGQLDDARIYNRALSASEIAALAGISAGLGPLTIERTDGMVRVTWEGPGQLQQADGILGPWSDVTPTGPNVYETTPGGAMAFFRLRQ